MRSTESPRKLGCERRPRGFVAGREHEYDLVTLVHGTEQLALVQVLPVHHAADDMTATRPLGGRGGSTLVTSRGRGAPHGHVCRKEDHRTASDQPCEDGLVVVGPPHP